MRRIAAKYVYTLDSFDPIVDGFVETEDDGTVIRTGKCNDLLSEPYFWDGAIMPGFVNAHCHVELSHLKGKFLKGSGMAGFIDQINALRDSSSREDKIKSLSLEMDRMWKSGVSAMADISNCDDSFAVKAESPMYTRTEYGLDASITPHASYTMSPELVTAAATEGLFTGYLSYHSQESPQEEEMIASGTGEMAENRRRAGMSTPPVTGKPSLMYFIDRLLKVHPAPFREHILLVHNVCLDETAAQAALAVMDNVFWAVCPLSNLFIHNALPPIELMRRLGLDICIGTDSLSSNDDLDMVREMFCLQHLPGRRPGIAAISDIDASGRLTASSRSVRLI